ncbi:hypothetical protein CkaCkLH20_07127 [Colletotrichum karsti]|uniref:Uncharacterized protein n=1 Tax=Colletotrichum karsti TaxID=1095194 RepID=A0A9P6I1L9_9PEZI|nr:uncharacterized protein CkaCkLH20_07127 [Colletotrichum karsti]KAF9875307.1 hypothetical protein CkaCkLH20_07127 [Colletotrichum karsti]
MNDNDATSGDVGTSAPAAPSMNLPEMRALVTPSSGAEEAAIGGFRVNQPNTIITIRLMNRGRVLYELSPGLTQYSYYVGFDGLQMRPVFVRRSNKGAMKTQDMSDNFRKGNLRVAGSWKQAELIIPPSDMLRPGQMSFLKARCAGFRLTDENGFGLRKLDPAEAREAQDIRDKQKENFFRGHPCPVYIQAPDIPIDYATVDDMKPENWAYFRMVLPKMAGRVVPEALIEELRSFSSRYSSDLVPLNLAISMCLVWCRYSLEPHHGAELAADANNDRNKQLAWEVPVPPLARFLLYSTHFLRFHEFYELSAYVHIFRYAVEMYNRDMWLSPAFDIDPSHIDECLVKQLYSTMSLQENDWMEIIPPSWDGSRMAMPANRGCRAMRSPETTAALMLPDINTLDFPTYSNAESYGLNGLSNYEVPTSSDKQESVWGRRDVHIHVDYVESQIIEEFSSAFVSGEVPFLASACLEPQDKEWDTVKLWTAPQTRVRRPWPQIPFAKNHAVISMQILASNRTIDQRQATAEGSFHRLDHKPPQKASQQAMTLGSTFEQATSDEPFPFRNELSAKDLRILRKLLEDDLADDKPISSHFRLLKQRTDLCDAGLTKQKIVESIKIAVVATDQAATKLQDFGLGQKLEEDEIVHSLIEPICILLGIVYTGSVVRAVMEILRVDESLGDKIGIFLRICSTSPSGMFKIREALGDLICSAGLVHMWRFTGSRVDRGLRGFLRGELESDDPFAAKASG